MTDVAFLPEPPTDAEMVSYVRPKTKAFMVWSLLSLVALVAAVVRMWSTREPLVILGVSGLAASAAFLALSLFIMFRGRRDFIYDVPVVDGAWPSVDVFLPVCGEPLAVLANTWDYVEQMTYPGTYRVYVLDDKADLAVEVMARQHGFYYIARENRGWFKKAGNVRHAFQQTHGDFILILDADFCPRHDMLTRSVPYMVVEPRLGILQTPQFFRTTDTQHWVQRGAASVQEFFYRAVQPARQAVGAAICVGTCALYRRTALATNGGPTLIEHSEDVHTGFDLQASGWTLRYIPTSFASGACPDAISGYYKQQYRWCTGSMSLLKSRKFWDAELGLLRRASYFTGFGYYISTAFVALTAPVLPIAMLGWHPDFVQLVGTILLLPAIMFGLFVYPAWHHGQYRVIETLAVRSVYSWAHALSIYDTLRGRVEGWTPTGAVSKGNKDFTRFYKAYLVHTVFWMLSVSALLAWRLPQADNLVNFVPMVAFSGLQAFIAVKVIREARSFR